jgi:hypothetical protein
MLRFEFESGTFSSLTFILCFLLENRVCLSRGLQVICVA